MGKSYGSAASVAKGLEDSLWYRTLTAEQKDVLVYSLYAEPATILFRDTCQSTTKVRKSFWLNGVHVAPTQTPRQLTMVCDGPHAFRLQLGRESLLLQGFPVQWVAAVADETPDRVLQDLAGNMASVPVLLSLAMCTFASISWREGPTTGATEVRTTHHSEMAQALEVLSSFASSEGSPGSASAAAVVGAPGQQTRMSGLRRRRS